MQDLEDPLLAPARREADGLRAGHRRSPAVRPRLRFLLDDLQSPVNIGQCARIAEVYGIELCVADPRGITASEAARKTISDFSCGAWQRRAIRVVPSAERVALGHEGGRVVATCVEPGAVRLHDFEFAPDDLLVFGNEYDGVGAGVLAGAHAKVYIAMPPGHLPKQRSHSPIDPGRRQAVSQNGVPNLNVAVSAGIVAYAWSCWLERRGHAAFG